MNGNRAIEVLKNNVPKMCKIVNGRYQGGFDDWESDTGQAIATAIVALEKQTAKKPDYEGDGCDNKGNIILDTWICPNCRKRYEVDYDDYRYCPECGQKIDWEN